MKEEKREIYNLKTVLCQFKFKKSTENLQELFSSFKGKENVSVKCERWKQTLDAHIKKSFRKIKVKKNKLKPSAADVLIDKRNSLKYRQFT